MVLIGISSLFFIIGLVFIVCSFWKDKDKSFLVCVFLCFIFVDVINVFGNLFGVIRYVKKGLNFVINEYFFCDLERFCVG